MDAYTYQYVTAPGHTPPHELLFKGETIARAFIHPGGERVTMFYDGSVRELTGPWLWGPLSSEQSLDRKLGPPPIFYLMRGIVEMEYTYIRALSREPFIFMGDERCFVSTTTMFPRGLPLALKDCDMARAWLETEEGQSFLHTAHIEAVKRKLANRPEMTRIAEWHRFRAWLTEQDRDDAAALRAVDDKGHPIIEAK